MSKIRKLYSQAGQDLWVMRDVFDYKTSGFFLDVGAYDGLHLSNTYALERNLNWNGICIEADSETFDKLKRNRSCCCINICVGKSEGEVEFITGRGPYSGSKDKRRDIEIRDDIGTTTRVIPTLPLNQILDQHGAPEIIDYFSLDVEGMEDDVMQTFPFDKHRFLCATIERPSLGLRQTLTKHGYLLVSDQPGMDAFYIHNQIGPAYTGKIMKRSANTASQFWERVGFMIGKFFHLGVRSSLRRL
jgi:FkbM family methyltransferase